VALQVELIRQHRVLRQLVAMHSYLRESYERRALVLDMTMLIGSIVLCALAFADEHFVASILLGSENSGLILRLSSLILLCASVASLRVDWKKRARDHEVAIKSLSEALSEFRNYHRDDVEVTKEIGESLATAYWRAVNNCTPIPDALFNVLKSRFLRRVEIGKLLESNPGLLHSIAWLKIVVRSFHRGGRRTSQ